MFNRRMLLLFLSTVSACTSAPNDPAPSHDATESTLDAAAETRSDARTVLPLPRTDAGSQEDRHSPDGAVTSDQDAAVFADARLSSCSYPRCLASLFATCRPLGSCTREVVNGRTRQCYANGVSIAAIESTDGNEAGFAIHGREGACYTIEADLVRSPALLTWRAPDGSKVADGVLADGRLTVTCSGDRPTLVGLDCDPTGTSSSDVSPTCELGTCW